MMNLKFRYGVLSAFVFASVQGFAATPLSYEWYLEYGKESMSAGRYERAADEFQGALSQKPDSQEAKRLLEQARTAVKRERAKVPPVTVKKIGSDLALGDYVCDTGAVGKFQARGVLTLKAGGRYDYTRGGGNYQYEASTGTIRFTSGYFFNTEGVGKFMPGKKVAQIDIDYAGPPSSYWSCGHNMP